LLRSTLNLTTDLSNDQNLVAIHIRKTDYITIDQDLKDSYYKLAIEKMLKLNSNLKFDIFTDSENVEIDLKVFKNINKVYLPKHNEQPIDVIKKMMSYRYYIIANSSFSTIPAYLSEFDEKIVIYPKPWWRNSDVKMQNIPSSWISVENK